MWFEKPDPFEHDADVWAEQATGFDKAAEAAQAIADDTSTAATEAVWKGPMPEERLNRMLQQAKDATQMADYLGQMASACRTISDEAETAKTAIDELRKEWDEGTLFDRMGSEGEADDIRGQFAERTSGARGDLDLLAQSMQPVINVGDPLDYLFSPIQAPGMPDMGEQLDQDAAQEYFETGKLIDPAQVQAIEDTITGVSDGEDPPSNWDEWAVTNGYSADEVQAALDNLDDEERAALNQWLGDNKGDPDNEQPDPGQPSLGLSSFLMRNMSAEQVQEFHNDVPNLEPTLHGDADGWVDGDVDMSPDTDFTDGGNGFTDIDQGGIGDCATLTSIAAAQAADPTFLDRHIQENPNGTYTVTVYDENGSPVQVTVNGFVPADGGNPAYNGDELDGEITWASIYEKAMAQYQGGNYVEIDGAYTPDRLETTTGTGSDKTELPLPFFLPPELKFQQMQEAFEDGKPIVLGGGGHAYSVVGFDDDGNVLVMNPWGGEGSVVAMTPDEFNSGQFPEPADDWPEFTYVAVTK
ncbi:C2 family cysteine protease [Jiangella muralis]|uniref:C2 family cysteine protease n=1 Tax=Jiangella muralis TaxID=702383 RepID=UPI00069D8985|nr:C2 family cysteine protease [Jiangella muralis]